MVSSIDLLSNNLFNRRELLKRTLPGMAAVAAVTEAGGRRKCREVCIPCPAASQAQTLPIIEKRLDFIKEASAITDLTKRLLTAEQAKKENKVPPFFKPENKDIDWAWFNRDKFKNHKIEEFRSLAGVQTISDFDSDANLLLVDKIQRARIAELNREVAEYLPLFQDFQERIEKSKKTGTFTLKDSEFDWARDNRESLEKHIQTKGNAASKFMLGLLKSGLSKTREERETQFRSLTKEQKRDFFDALVDAKMAWIEALQDVLKETREVEVKRAQLKGINPPENQVQRIEYEIRDIRNIYKEIGYNPETKRIAQDPSKLSDKAKNLIKAWVDKHDEWVKTTGYDRWKKIELEKNNGEFSPTSSINLMDHYSLDLKLQLLFHRDVIDVTKNDPKKRSDLLIELAQLMKQVLEGQEKAKTLEKTKRGLYQAEKLLVEALRDEFIQLKDGKYKTSLIEANPSIEATRITFAEALTDLLATIKPNNKQGSLELDREAEVLISGKDQILPDALEKFLELELLA